MIYLIKGSDTVAARHKFEALITSLLARRREASLFRVESASLELARLQELAVAQDLFVRKYIVGCVRLLSDPVTREEVLPLLPLLAASDNIFIFLEETLDAATSRKIAPHIAKDLSFDRTLTTEKSFNVFSLPDALLARDRQALWVAYQRALRAGYVAEEIFWKLIWAVKNLLAVKKSAQPEDSGLKGFVLAKTTQKASRYAPGEAEILSQKLVDIFYASRRGRTDLAIALEKLIFEI
jgi:hypothetical protein